MTTFTPIASRRSLARVPLISDKLAKLHNIYHAADTRYRRCARMLQALWLKDQGIAAAHTADPEHLTYNDFASTLHPAEAAAGRNFISAAIYNLVLRELVLREEGACVDEQRLVANALSSAPMVFNLFGELALNLDLATAVFRDLFPQAVDRVTHIGFEHSEGRHSEYFLSDGTAFDVVVRFQSVNGENASIYVEGKYSEGSEGPPARWRSRYEEAMHEVRLFKDPDAPILRSTALEQFTREQVLAQLHVDRGLTSGAIFLVIAPQLNRRIQTALRVYAKELLEPDDTRVPFVNCTLERFVQAIDKAGASDLASALWDRYLDFERVYEMALVDVGALPASAEPDASSGAGPLTNDHPASTLPPVRPRRSHTTRTGRYEASPPPASSNDRPIEGTDASSSCSSARS